jgi:hypothetical protein
LAPLTCSGGAAPTCGCAGETASAFCSRLAKDCDLVSAFDNCGKSRTENCGTCSGTQRCGGGGTPNVCGEGSVGTGGGTGTLCGSGSQLFTGSFQAINRITAALWEYRCSGTVSDSGAGCNGKIELRCGGNVFTLVDDPLPSSSSDPAWTFGPSTSVSLKTPPGAERFCEAIGFSRVVTKFANTDAASGAWAWVQVSPTAWGSTLTGAGLSYVEPVSQLVCGCH